MASEIKILEAIFGPSIPTEKAEFLPEIMGHIRAIDDLLQGKYRQRVRLLQQGAILDLATGAVPTWEMTKERIEAIKYAGECLGFFDIPNKTGDVLRAMLEEAKRDA